MHIQHENSGAHAWDRMWPALWETQDTQDSNGGGWLLEMNKQQLTESANKRDHPNLHAHLSGCVDSLYLKKTAVVPNYVVKNTDL